MKPNPHRETDFHYEKIIIGSSVEAMVTAFKYQIPIIGDITHKPLPHYYIPADLDLSPIQCNNKRTKFTYLNDRIDKRGMPAIELWDIMHYRLSLMGLAPFWGASYAALEDIPKHHALRQMSLTHKNRIINVTFDHAIIFDYPK